MNISLREATSEDFSFAFIAKKQAMGPHIREKWDWDESYQMSIHQQRWSEKPWFVITVNEVDAGTVSLDEIDTNTLRFGEFYLIDEFRNKGIGTKVLTSVLKESDAKSQKIILEYLKWNPVGSLYMRHGFSIVSETEIHYNMERKPKC